MKQRRFGWKLAAALSAAAVAGAGASAWAWIGSESSTSETLAESNTPVWITRSEGGTGPISLDEGPNTAFVEVHNDHEHAIYLSDFPVGSSPAYSVADDGFFCPAATLVAPAF